MKTKEMAQKVGPFGGNKGDAFDDGVLGYTGLKKVTVGENGNGVDCIKIEYEKDGTFETQMHGSVTGILKEFELNYPDEYITSIQGTYSNVARYNTTIVKTLTFKTSHGRTSPMFGNTAIFSTDFVVEGKAGTKLIGFHGSTSVKHSHGKMSEEPKEFKVDDPNEYVTSVEGTYNFCGDVTSLTFKTSKGRVSTGFGRSSALGAHFAPPDSATVAPVPTPVPTPVAPVPAPVPAKKLEAKGGDHGAAWDDGFYEDVRKIYVGQGDSGVSFIKFEYDVGKKLVAGDGHGKMSLLGTEEFELDFPNEYIVSVEGCYDKQTKNAQKVEAQGGKGGNQWDDGSEHDAVTKIQVGAGGIGIQYVKFDYVKNGQTEEAPLRGIKGRSIPADPFVINHPEEHLVSVEGWYNPEGLIQGLKFNSNKKSSDFHLVNPCQKLPALGSDEGTAWDDGAHHGVKKVYVGQGHDGVSAVKFEYVNGSEVVAGDERGKPTLLGFEEFELDYPSEYITVVHGTVDKIFGSDSAIITMLKFETNKRTSNPFGLEAGASFKVKEEGHKIVGFHGKANELLHQIGVHVLPITN
ncbi:hypothetical protein Bca52824_086075 [Brassica carinata]|uniref:Jacalin-type lectin domain-containing protein n=1 Tax=Brassica carinata TaxID=52824 RepID=A0A8X7P9G6_BRACI|nr:hypothetical protein Bca52824_086075 [Brassica carinata]